MIAQISAALHKHQRGPLRQALFNMRMRRLLREVDRIAALSDRATAEADAIMRRPLALTIPLPALEDDTPLPVHPSTEDRLIMAAGRLVPEKGFDTLIDAFALAADPAARLVIVGAGPDEARLRQRAAACGVASRVDLPGYAADIRPWLDKARLFVLPSRYEGYPAVLIEAFAAGRPIVATDCTPATAELGIEGTAGRTVAIDDVHAMAGAIRSLLDAPPPDPAMLAQRVDRFRIGPVARRYLDLFESIRSMRGEPA